MSIVSRIQRHLGNFPFSTLRSRLVILVLLAVFPALGLTLYTGLEERQIQSAQVQENALRLTRLAAGDLIQVTEGARQLLVGLAQLSEVRQASTGACEELFAKLVKQYPYYINLGVIDSNGDLSCSALPVEMPVNLSDRGFFRRASSTRGFAVSGYQIESVTKKAIINFAHPVLADSGAVQSIVFASLDLEWFNQLEVEAQLPASSALIVIDHRGRILARYPDSEKWVGRLMPEEPVVKAIISQQSEGTVEVAGMDGVMRLYGVTSINADSDAKIFVSIGLSKGAVFGPVYRVFARNLIALGIVGVLSLLAAWFGGNIFILRRIKRLVTATKQIAAGDLNVRIGSSYENDEISTLAGSFDEMAESLEQRTIQLHQAEAKYRTLVEHIPMVTYAAHWNKFNGAFYISPQIQSALGFSPEEWLRDSRLWLTRIHPDDRERVLAEFQYDPLKDGKAKFHSEYRIRSRIGDLRWFHDEAVVVEDGAGDPQFLQGILLDITEQKEAEEQLKTSRQQLRHLAAHIETVREEERTWIAREIHDELGQSLTGLKMELSWLEKKMIHTSHPISTPLLLEKLESMKELVDTTISSVRRIATQLRPGILDSLGLIAAIEWQAMDFQARTGIECKFALLPDSTVLDEKRSSAIFRIFQEILTNVARHANATGVSTSMREEAGNLILEVEDNGRGITEEEKSNVRSLGLLGMKERANLLGGEVRILGSNGHGTTVTVRIPVVAMGEQLTQNHSGHFA